MISRIYATFVAMLTVAFASTASAGVVGSATLLTSGVADWNPTSGTLTISGGSFHYSNSLPMTAADYTLSVTGVLEGVANFNETVALGNFALADVLATPQGMYISSFLGSLPPTATGTTSFLGMPLSGTYAVNPGSSPALGNGTFSGSISDGGMGDLTGFLGSIAYTGKFGLNLTLSASVSMVPVPAGGALLLGGLGLLGLTRRKRA